MEHFLTTGILDLGILVFGFLIGLGTKFRLPIMLTLFLIRVVKWWLETHPHGKELSKKTTLDEEFKKTFASEIKQVEKVLNMDGKNTP